MDFIISCESNIDRSYAYAKSRGLFVLFLNYTMKNKIYEENMWRDAKLMDEFHKKIRKHAAYPSSVSYLRYLRYFESRLKEGHEIIHICSSSKVSDSYMNALAAADYLEKKYPYQRIRVVDSRLVTCGYGLLVEKACDLKDEGKSYFEIYDYLEREKECFNTIAFSSHPKYLYRIKRMHWFQALLVKLHSFTLHFEMDHSGYITYTHLSKFRKIVAVKRMVQDMKESVPDVENFNDKIFITHGRNETYALLVRQEILKEFPSLQQENIILTEESDISVSYLGPELVCLAFKGLPRDESKK
jgi:DegV family protein with EDD domain